MRFDFGEVGHVFLLVDGGKINGRNDAFLSAYNAFENSADTIPANSGKLSSSLTDEIAPLNTLNKFEVFAIMHGQSIDRGDDRYSRTKQVIRCNNDFAHRRKASMCKFNPFPRVGADEQYAADGLRLVC